MATRSTPTMSALPTTPAAPEALTRLAEAAAPLSSASAFAQPQQPRSTNTCLTTSPLQPDAPALRRNHRSTSRAHTTRASNGTDRVATTTATGTQPAQHNNTGTASLFDFYSQCSPAGFRQAECGTRTSTTFGSGSGSGSGSDTTAFPPLSLDGDDRVQDDRLFRSVANLTEDSLFRVLTETPPSSSASASRAGDGAAAHDTGREHEGTAVITRGKRRRTRQHGTQPEAQLQTGCSSGSPSQAASTSSVGTRLTRSRSRSQSTTSDDAGKGNGHCGGGTAAAGTTRDMYSDSKDSNMDTRNRRTLRASRKGAEMVTAHRDDSGKDSGGSEDSSTQSGEDNSLGARGHGHLEAAVASPSGRRHRRNRKRKPVSAMEEEELERVRELGRKHARKARRVKKQREDSLAQQSSELQVRNELLRTDIEHLRQKVVHLQSLVVGAAIRREASAAVMQGEREAASSLLNALQYYGLS